MMEKNRQTKVIAIIALVVAVVGMSLGFAAFSNILTISSSATVTPNEEDFKLVAYGLEESISIAEWENMAGDVSKFTSAISGKPILAFLDDSYAPVEASTATIDNKSLTISNLSLGFSEPNQNAFYPFMIKNEGYYDAYLDSSIIKKFNDGVTPTKCTGGTGTTVELVNSACNSIISYVVGLDSSNQDIFQDVSKSYKIAAGDYILVGVAIVYDSNGARADGPFDVEFEDVKFNFSTAA